MKRLRGGAPFYGPPTSDAHHLPAPPKQTCVRCTVPGFGEGALACLGTSGLEPGSFLTVTVVRVCAMPKTEFDGLPVIEVPDTEEITVAVKPDDMQEGEKNDPEQHPIAIALGGQSESMMRACPSAR